MTEENPGQPATKSKQERIRDNQRRSRARRQEYLQDLERRLSECHVTCREADMQREMFQQLQVENLRLRELLTLSGVNPDLIENYVSQGASNRSNQEGNSNLRQIKPKIPTVGPAQHGTIVAGSSSRGSKPGANMSPTLTNPSYASPSAISTTGVAPASRPYANYQTNPASTPMLAYHSNTPSVPSSSFDWLYHPQQTKDQHSPHSASPVSSSVQSPTGPAFCEAFQMSYDGPNIPAAGNTILCSVAKSMIEQYNVSAEEMEEIKGRLGPNFARPSFPGHECSVSNQVLFQVLNELSTRYG